MGSGTEGQSQKTELRSRRRCRLLGSWTQGQSQKAELRSWRRCGAMGSGTEGQSQKTELRSRRRCRLLGSWTQGQSQEIKCVTSVHEWWTRPLIYYPLIVAHTKVPLMNNFPLSHLGTHSFLYPIWNWVDDKNFSICSFCYLPPQISLPSIGTILLLIVWRMYGQGNLIYLLISRPKEWTKNETMTVEINYVLRI